MEISYLEFSGPTYQIEVFDRASDAKFWTFLQFDEQAILKDAFCSCESSAASCPHLDYSFLTIYKGKSQPLHVRFEHSFWNQLFQIFAEELPEDQALVSDDTFLFENTLSLSIEPKSALGKRKLHEILEDRKRQTPENSIKFSTFSQEEIGKWKSGRPSFLLRYELSIWSDLAKLFFLSQEEESYVLNFEEDSDGLPTRFTATFAHFRASFIITAEVLSRLVPFLHTIASPLKVREKGKTISNITYNDEKREFEIEKSKINDVGGIAFSNWIYIPSFGFSPQEQGPFRDEKIIGEQDIPKFLENEHETLSNHLVNVSFHQEKIPLSYELYFDDKWNLHLTSFLFEKGDLKKGRSHLFGHYAYLEGKGFYPLEGVLFDKEEIVIVEKEVSRFVHAHRIQLSRFSGFETHLQGIETSLSYEVTPDYNLRLFSKASLADEIKDFDDWIYLKGEGFFPKKRGVPMSLSPGKVPPDQIDAFIKRHRDDLENVPHFFYPLSPIARIFLKIEAGTHSSIIITPILEPLAESQNLPLKLFGDFLYVDTKGFYPLPPNSRLPQKYAQKTILSKEEAAQFLEHELPKFSESLIEIDPRLKVPHQFQIELSNLEKSPGGGLLASFSFRSELGRVSDLEIKEAFEKKSSFLFSDAGMIDLREDRFAWMRKLETKGDKLVVPTLDFLRLDAELPLFVPSENERTSLILTELRSFHVAEKPDLKGFKSTLRTYQQTGLEWLWFLHQNNLSGLLCDEMGLGKTHQAMGVIRASYNQKPGPILIVAPTSVVYHWQEKLNMFLPGIKVHLFHGLKRSLKKIPKNGILLTSYGILRIEKEALLEREFDIAVFDEIQVAKNPSSRIHKILGEVKAKMRLGLTGTPIENNLTDLKSLFDVVLPNYFPSEKKFRDEFVLPIEREGSQEKKALLTKITRPFILRRKKKEVLVELPEKTEDKLFADLTEEQEMLYSKAVEGFKLGQAPYSYIHIFSIITKLKQICDHSALYLGESENYKKHTSGKWTLFTEILREALDSEQKVVVFSQYLEMLNIIGSYLREEKIGYAEIRGATKDRQKEIERFQNDPDCRVFVGSLQAAGVGIDLTAASTVILYDRWWNAARENQAIDRVHRIGQKWGVQVYKLIAKGTIEEKIDAMITKKGFLLEDVIEADDESLVKKLDPKELAELLMYTK